MTYQQFIQELEDDILPSDAEHRYQEYKTEYITTQKRAYFDAHKDEEWLKDKYHPTNFIAVIERKNELTRQSAKEFLLELQSGTLDLGRGLTASSNKSGHGDDANSDDETDAGGKRRHHGRGSARDTDLSSAPKAHPISSDSRRIQIDVEQAQALVHKLDSEKGVEDNILVGSVNEKTREKAHGSSSGPVIIIRSFTSVKGLEGTDLLDTLLTYLWHIHGVDYYGMKETSEAKGLRHVRAEGRNPDRAGNGSEWEKNLDSCWQERLSGQDPLELRTAKEKIDAAAVEVLDPHVRKIRDEKYGCGAKGCTKLFHAAEFVHKHLKLKHTELVMELTSKLREDLYFQNYMDDPDTPGGTPVMQRSRPQRCGPLEHRLRDDRGLHRDRANRFNRERFDRSDNPRADDVTDGTGGEGNAAMFDPFGATGIGAPFGSDFPPPRVLMPIPGAGPLGPFVPAAPEVAMQMFHDQGDLPFEGGGRNGRPGPQLNGPAPIIASFSGLWPDPQRLRSYQDLDAPEEEVTVMDYRSL